MQYQYEALGDDNFQRMIQALLACEYGPGLIAMPLGEADGGRDAHLHRTVVFQVKFTRAPVATKKRVKWLLDTVDKESHKIQRLAARGARRYIMVTNVYGTGDLDRGTIDRLDSELARRAVVWGLDEMLVWWRDSLDRRFDAAPVSLKLTYADALPSSQAVSLTMLSRSASAILEFQAETWNASRLEDYLLRGEALVHAQDSVLESELPDTARAFLRASVELRDRHRRHRADKIISAVEGLPEEESYLAVAVTQTVIEEIVLTHRAQFSLWGLTARPRVWRFLVGPADNSLTHVAWLPGGGFRTIDAAHRVATWDAEGGLIKARRFSDQMRGSCALSGDGEYLYHAGVVWRASDGTRLADTGRRPSVLWSSWGWTARSLDWQPDNRIVVKEEPGRFAQLTMQAGELVRTGEATVKDGDFVEWSPSGRDLAVTIQDPRGRSRIGVYSAANPDRPNRVIGSATSDVRQWAWSPDGRLIATVVVGQGQDSPEVRVHTRGGRRLKVWSGYTVPNLCWSPDGRLLAAGSAEYTNVIEIRVARTGELLAELVAADWHINDLWWSPDGTTIIAQDPEQTYAWRVNRSKGNRALTVDNHFRPFAKHAADSASWAHNRQWAVLRSGHEAYVVSRTKSPRLLDRNVLDVRYSPTEDVIAGARPGEVRLWPAADHADHRDIPIAGIRGIVWSPDGRRIALVHVPDAEDALADRILLWDLQHHRQTGEIELLDLAAYPAWSPDSQLLAVPHGDDIVIYDGTTGGEHARLPNPDKEITAIAWSPTADRIVAATVNELKTWSVANGSTGETVSWASGQPLLCCSPDGTMAAASLDEGDAGVDVWDIETGAQYRLAVSGLVVDLSWTDGLRAVLSDGNVLCWPAPDRAVRNRTRPLTTQERQRFGLDPEPPETTP